MAEKLAELLWPWLFLGIANEADFPEAFRCLLLLGLILLFSRVRKARIYREGSSLSRPGSAGGASFFGNFTTLCVREWIMAFTAGFLIGTLLNLLLGILIPADPAGGNLGAIFEGLSRTLETALRILEILILKPAAEELVYRGLIYEKLRQDLAVWPAAILTALWFGVSHGHLLQGIYAGIFGIALAVCYEKKGILSAIFCHIGGNAGALLLFFLSAG